WSNPSIASQDPIDAALVPPLKRSRDIRHTLTALPALPQLSLLFRREPCPCMPLHSHTSSSAKIRRCCVDSLNSPPTQASALIIELDVVAKRLDQMHNADCVHTTFGVLARGVEKFKNTKDCHNVDTDADLFAHFSMDRI